MFQMEFRRLIKKVADRIEGVDSRMTFEDIFVICHEVAPGKYRKHM
jgi:hypothetical protein